MNNKNEIIKQICNEDVERKSKIDKLCQSPRLSEKEKKEISDFTQEFGDTLSGSPGAVQYFMKIYS